MIDETLDTVEGLQGALIVAESFVSSIPKDTPFDDFQLRFVLSFLIGKGLDMVVFFCFGADGSRGGKLSG